ncbi:MAG: hypothetical protein ACD_62C00458G0001, partial [uncultured bacterium]
MPIENVRSTKDCSLHFWLFKNSPRARSAFAGDFEKQVSKSG